jgi:pyrroline-5-carboxylate reductase
MNISPPLTDDELDQLTVEILNSDEPAYLMCSFEEAVETAMRNGFTRELAVEILNKLIACGKVVEHGRVN